MIVAEASLLTGAFLVTGLDISVLVWALLDGFSAGFHFLVLKVWCCRVFSHMFILASWQSWASRARVMFIGAFISSSARLGLLTVPSYKKFSAVDALVVFGDVKASSLYWGLLDLLPFLQASVGFLLFTTWLRHKASNICLRDFRVNSIILHTEKFRSMYWYMYLHVLLMCLLGHINSKPSHLHNAKTIAQHLMGLISIAECVSY